MSWDGKGNCPRRVIEFRQGNALVAGHEGVGSRSHHVLLPVGVNLLQILVSLNVKIRYILPVLNISLNINLSVT